MIEENDSALPKNKDHKNNEVLKIIFVYTIILIKNQWRIGSIACSYEETIERISS